MPFLVANAMSLNLIYPLSSRVRMYLDMPDDIVAAMDHFHTRRKRWRVVEAALKRTYPKDSKKYMRRKLCRLQAEDINLWNKFYADVDAKFGDWDRYMMQNFP